MPSSLGPISSMFSIIQVIEVTIIWKVLPPEAKEAQKAVLSFTSDDCFAAISVFLGVGIHSLSPDYCTPRTPLK